MKKSKLLMPLTGIAAIGAIAPVAVMTSCNKGTSTNEFIASVKCGTIVDGHTELMTTKLGIESFQSTTTGTYNTYAAVDFAVTIKDDFKWLDGDTLSVVIPAKGTAGATGTPFTIKSEVKTSIVPAKNIDQKIWYREWDEDDGFLEINSEKMEALKDAGTSEKFSFDVIYTITHQDKTTTSQTVTYEVEACPALHDVCVMNNVTTPATEVWAFDGANVVSSTDVTIDEEGGVFTTANFFDTDALEDLTIQISSDAKWVTADKSNTLTLNSTTNSTTAGSRKFNEDFKGTLASKTTAAAAAVAFTSADTAYIVCTVSGAKTDSKYVLSSWTTSIILDGTYGSKTIKVTTTEA